jgi:ankyrin repeat protein
MESSDLASSQLLEACATGNLEKLTQLQLQEIDVQCFNDEGCNGLHLAIANGHWSIVWYLLNTMEISPHRIANNGDGIYHFILRAILAKPPTVEDFAEMKSECEVVWR